MKYVLAFLLVVLTSVSSANVQPVMAESNLAKDIILFEANTYRVSTEFNVHGMQKDKESAKTLFNVLARGDELSLLFTEQSAELAPSWNEYRSFVWKKHKQTGGEIDNYVFNDMRILHSKLLNIIVNVKKQINTELLPAKDLNKVNGILLIEQLASEYIEISANTFGVFGFAGNDHAIQIENRSEAFERVIAELKNIYADDAASLRKVKKLALRWKFIKNTLLAYNQRTAPFAVARTVDYIREQLVEL